MKQTKQNKNNKKTMPKHFPVNLIKAIMLYGKNRE